MLLAVLLGLGLVGGVGSAAHADLPTGIVSADIIGLPGGNPPVVGEGASYVLRVQYSNQVPGGYELHVTLGASVGQLVPPTANSGIDSVTTNGNEVIIRFKDPFPATVNQGVFDLGFKMNPVDETELGEIRATVDTEVVVEPVIIKNDGDTQANVTDSQTKGVNPGNLNGYVRINNGTVTLDDSVLDQELTYTLTVNTPAGTTRTGYDIADQLPAGLSYVAGSFATRLTTWADVNAPNTPPAYWNQHTDDPGPAFIPAITGNAFSGTVAQLTGPSVYTVTYKVEVTDKAAVEQALQQAYDGLQNQGDGTTVKLPNTATFGPGGEGNVKTAAVGVFVAKGPGPGGAFAKTSDWATGDGKNNVVVGIPDAAGTLNPPADLTYSFKADLRQWNETDADRTLQRNVVLVDDLDPAASWNTGAADFLTVAGTGLTLATTPTSPCTTDQTAFASTAVGSWCVSGHTLMVNVGRDKSTNATVQAKAAVDTVDGLTEKTPAANYSSVVGATAYNLPNTGSVNWRTSGNAYGANHDVTPVTMPDDTDGWQDTSTFDKSSVVTPVPGQGIGEPREVTYTFKVGAGKGIDARDSKIVDTIDRTVFDVDGHAPVVSGVYSGGALSAADYTLSWVGDELTIELSDAGKAKVDTAGADKAWQTDLVLVTFPVGSDDQPATLELHNHAELQSAGGTPEYFDDDAREVTSFGDEAEVRKRVYDRKADEWTDFLHAQIDADGNVLQDTYVYRIQFIPWGSYNGVTIFDVVDNLPSGVEFLGFVTKANAPAATDPVTGPVDVGGNLESVQDGGVVTIRQKAGTVLNRDAYLPGEDSLSAYVAVRITDPGSLGDQSIVNSIGATKATIEAATYAVGDYVWVDSNKDGIQDAGEPVLPGVKAELLRGGQVVATTTTDANGRYLFDELPEGDYQVRFTLTPEQAAIYHYTGADASADATDEQDSDGVVDVDDAAVSTTAVFTLDETNAKLRPAGTGTGEYDDQGFEATMGIDPTWDAGVIKETYAIGDIVWIDADKNGVQDPTESPLAGVTATLLDVDGDPVPGVPPTTTDAEGRYKFDNLPAGTYRVRFDLTDEQAAKFRFTTADLPGADDKADSDGEVTSPEAASATTGPIELNAQSSQLTKSYPDQPYDATEGIDPTWDAGVVFKRVSVGDYVWIDENRNGVQDGGEPPIPGVTLTITRSDGGTVTNSDGSPKTGLSTTTDGNGKYLFDNLEVLPPGVHYVVSIDISTVPAGLRPTKPGQGDRGNDSSTGSTESTDLTHDGDADLTLDFGFVRPEVAVTVNTKASLKRAETGSSLYDQVRVQGLGAGQTAPATATLYGPYANKRSMTCAPASAVRTVSLTATSDWVDSPKVKVDKPGYYVWVASVAATESTLAGTHDCALASETTLVHRPAYQAVRIETGYDGYDDFPERALPLVLKMAKLHINAPMQSVGAANGEMKVPGSTRQLGWLNLSAAIDDLIGTTVVAGHVSDNHDSPGALWNLRKARKGQVFKVEQGGKTLRFKVKRINTYQRGKALPSKYFDVSGKHKLVVVSCSDKTVYSNGRFHYRKNLVVTLVPIHTR